MRYAIYYSPERGSPLHELGATWLGRDAESGRLLAQPAISGLRDVTKEARRYGFHGTLKPPFALKEGKSLEELRIEARNFASRHTEVDAGLLVLREIDGFLALTPEQSVPALDDLAEQCVRQFDGLRAPASSSELARRRAAGLSARQEANLERWGYPYVMQEFQFHLTLTSRLAAGISSSIRQAAERYFAAVIGVPLVIGAISIFAEPAPGEDFLVIEQISLQPRKQNRAAS